MPHKILVFKNRKIIKILRINVEARDIKNPTIYIDDNFIFFHICK